MDIIPFDQRDGYIWYNGEFVNWKDAKVHVLNHGLHYASCVFEGERIYGGKIFKCTDHSSRLHSSAEMLGFAVPYSVITISHIQYCPLDLLDPTLQWIKGHVEWPLENLD